MNELVDTAFAIEDRVGVSARPGRGERLLRPDDRSSRDRRRRPTGSHGRRARLLDVFVSDREADDLAARGRVPRRARRRSSAPGRPARAALPLPQIRLPFLFSDDVGRREIGTLADALRRRGRARCDARRPPTARRRGPRRRLLRQRRRRQDHDRRRCSRSRARGAVGDAVVVTIDPAKRLANALGLDGAVERAARDRAPSGGIPKGDAPGRRALGDDARHEVDVRRARARGTRADGDQAGGILENRFYRNISTALAGTQEYMAMEKLHELHEEGGFDLIVVDTPPTPARARLPRRAEAAPAPARQPHLPDADGADARRHARRRRRGAGVPAHDRARSSAPRSSTTSSRSSARSRAWRTASASGPRRSSRSSASPSTRFVLVTVAAARRRRRGGASSPSRSATTTSRSTR